MFEKCVARVRDVVGVLLSGTGLLARLGCKRLSMAARPWAS
jgi:hypothetical protein